MKRSFTFLLSVLFLFVLSATTAHAQFSLSQDLQPAAITQGDRAGKAVAVYGQWALVGAPTEPLNDPEWDNVGAAYFYKRQNDGTWVEMQQVLPANTDFQARFGWAVTMWDEYAAVSAPRQDTDAVLKAGVVYLYERVGNVWNQIEVLTASDPTFCGRFGSSVSLWNGELLIGAAPPPDMPAPGAAYVFERQDNGTWIEVDKLVASDGLDYDGFGFGVGVSGNYAIVGAPFAELTEEAELGDHFAIEGGGIPVVFSDSEGKAYVFERDPGSGTWSEIQKLSASDPQAQQWFGYAVSISGSGLVVGAYGDDDDTGAAYIFEENASTWSETQKLTASDGETEDLFGTSVSMSGSRLLVGASRDNDPESHAGSAYAFERAPDGTWSETQKLTVVGDFGIHGAQFGIVALSGTRAVIGAPLYGHYAYGNAYVFEYEGAHFCGGIVGSGELTFDMGNNGLPTYNLQLDAGRGASLDHVIFTSTLASQTEDHNAIPTGFAAYLKDGDLVASTSPRQWVVRKRGSQTATFQFPVLMSALYGEGGGVHVEVASSCGAMASINLNFEMNPNDPTHGRAVPTMEVIETQAGLPQRFELEGNYPNPFNPQTTIRYALPEQALVSLTVYDVTGRVVRSLVSGVTQTAGWHEATFEATDLPSGTYLYRLQAGTFSQTGRMVLLK